MTNIIIILALLAFLGSVATYLFLELKKAGRNEANIKHTEQVNESLSDENTDLANRPRSLFDRVKRLQQWRDQLPKN